MSAASDSVMAVTRYPESSPMNGGLYSHEERTVRKPERAEASFLDTIVGRRGSLRRILSQVEAVAGTNATVLITGETGTGKEVIARAIHELSPRRNRNLVKVNCAAMPAGLLESELFGHERGAFTGAINSHVGRFALADRGTLFLDEIGDMPLELQPKLLRVLQEREFEAVGSTRTTRVDVRVVAATNQDLKQMVRDREFREDLYYRLNAFPIYLPPLRERKADIPELVEYFVQQFAASMDKTIETIPEETMRALVRHCWPGNIRELQNYIARGVILSNDGVFEPAPLESRAPLEPEPEVANPTLEDKVRREILAACQRANWKLGGPRGAAARLGLKRTTLFYKMKRLGIAPPADHWQD
ncbi:MAG: sigma 54-interacting transcriptional regulator [Acidobacteria bacterium Pan2503]|uniref:Sigma 54-interacting transcriptional regulator n=1 Tax=Candidatus Acidiferrum panamense TaxID=2741543 RepID=A0A7V8NUF6_9BACT|nr:sigma 54-interacting transcriptional regulator [Candidatus Acidoferrum panamensis]